MELVYYHAPNLNFGDDLNPYIWDRVLPASVLESDIVLVGIGSILAEWSVGHLAGSKKRVVVMGSGTSYGRPPVDMTGWHVAALRGPITAAVVGHPEAAVTDGAILLAATDLASRAPTADKIVFMPHHKSLKQARWEKIAVMAGLDFVSPHLPVPEVLKKLETAKLVVTEAMHGAIVADTLRIPWVPVALSPEFEELKWRDWTRSMDLPCRPIFLPASSSNEGFRNRTMQRKLRDRGFTAFPALDDAHTADEYRAYLSRRFGKTSAEQRVAQSVPGMRSIMKKAASLFDPVYAQLSSKALVKAAQSAPYLSTDRVFINRLDRMQEAVRGLEKLV